MKAHELRNKGVPTTLAGKQYTIHFDMNTFCELEEIYGDINLAFEDLAKQRLKAIRALLYAALKAQDETLTLTKVGEILSLSDMEGLATSIYEALDRAMPEKEEQVGE